MSKKGAGTRNSPIAIDDSEDEVVNELWTSSLHSTPPNHSPTAEGSLSQHQHTSTLIDRLYEEPQTAVTKKRKRAGSSVTTGGPPVVGPSRPPPYQQQLPPLENRLSGKQESKKAKRKRRRKNERLTQEALYKARTGQQGNWDGQFMSELPGGAPWPPPPDIGYQDLNSFASRPQFGAHVDPRSLMPLNTGLSLDYANDLYGMPYYDMGVTDSPPPPPVPSSSTWVSSMVMAGSEYVTNTDIQEHNPSTSWQPPQPSQPPPLPPQTPIEQGRPVNSHNALEFHNLPPKPLTRVAPQPSSRSAPQPPQRVAPPPAPRAAPPPAPRAAPPPAPRATPPPAPRAVPPPAPRAALPPAPRAALPPAPRAALPPAPRAALPPAPRAAPLPRGAPQPPSRVAPQPSLPAAPKASPPTAPKAPQAMSNQIIGMMPDPDPKSKHGVFTLPEKGQGANEAGTKLAYIPNPARTLVMEQIPKVCRNADFVYSWSKSACGAQPVHISVDSPQGKALVEFATAELARKAWGSPKLGKQNVGLKPHQLKGKPREDQIKVWWYRVVGVGAGAGVGEIEEGEIEGEEGGGEVKVEERKETKRERKARLAKEREEKKTRKEREKAQKEAHLRKMGSLQDAEEEQAHPGPSAPRPPHPTPAAPTQSMAPMPVLNGIAHHQPAPNVSDPSLSHFLPAMQAVNWNSLVAPVSLPPYPSTHYPQQQQNIHWPNHPQQPLSALSSYGASLPQDVNGGYDDRESIASSRGTRSMSPDEAMSVPPHVEELEDYEDMEVEDGDERVDDGDDMELDSPINPVPPFVPLPVAATVADTLEVQLPAANPPSAMPQPALASINKPGEPPQVLPKEGPSNTVVPAAAKPVNVVPTGLSSSAPSNRNSTLRPVPSEPRAVRNAPTGPSHAKRSLIARQKELEERIAQSKRELELSLAAKAAGGVRKSAPSPPPIAPPAVETPAEETDKQAMEDRLRKLVLQSQRAKTKPTVSVNPSPPLAPVPVLSHPPASTSSAASSIQNSRTSSVVSSSSTTPDLPKQALSTAATHTFSLDDLAVSFITQTIQTVKSHPPLSTPAPPPPPTAPPSRSNTKTELAAKQKRLEQHIAESKVLIAKLTQARTKEEKDAIRATLRDMSRAMEEEDRVTANSFPTYETPKSATFDPPRRQAWNPSGPVKMRWPDSQADAGVLIVSDDEDDEADDWMV